MKSGRLLIFEGKNILHEPGLEELFKKVKKNYYPTTDFSKVEASSLVFFTKDTPKDNFGSQKELIDLIDEALPHFKQKVTIVIMSQVPIGFCRKVKKRIQKKRPDLSFSLYHWVDILVMTSAIERFSKPERIMIGSNNPSISLSPALKKGLKLFNCPVFNMSYESAEMTKAAINLYLANSVTYANTLSDFCEAYGANINEIIPALQTDKRIGPHSYLRPTLRISGGHLERDLEMLKRLSKKSSISPGVVNFILDENSRRYQWIIRKLKPLLSIRSNAKICIWGLSYKKNTTSTHNAASIKVITDLSKQSSLNVYDPMAILPKELAGYKRFKNKYDALKGADCLLILTEWDEFEKANTKRIKNIMKNPFIVDSTGILYKKAGRVSDLSYVTMGVA